MQSDSGKRNNEAMKLALLWLKTNRPDVWKAAKAEAEKRFPSPAATPKVELSLPDAMSKLK